MRAALALALTSCAIAEAGNERRVFGVAEAGGAFCRVQDQGGGDGHEFHAVAGVETLAAPARLRLHATYELVYQYAVLPSSNPESTTPVNVTLVSGGGRVAVGDALRPWLGGHFGYASSDSSFGMSGGYGFDLDGGLDLVSRFGLGIDVRIVEHFVPNVSWLDLGAALVARF